MDRRKRLLILSMISIPIAWVVLQFYHLVISKPIIKWIIASFPQLSENFAMPYPFVASLLNLAIFGTLAAIWPELGFGHTWKPNRQQSIVVLSLVIVSIIYPILYMSSGYATPFKQMGFIIWTITPVQEEIIFRGFLYSLLLRLFKRSPQSSLKDVLPVLLLGAVWFSLWHLSPHAIMKYGWQLIGIQLVLTFFAGLIFNWLRHWTGSIWLVIPVHAAGNFMVTMM